MKVLTGCVLERRFKTFECVINDEGPYQNAIYTPETPAGYIHDSIGLHQMFADVEKCVTIHLYSPSNYKYVA